MILFSLLCAYQINISFCYLRCCFLCFLLIFLLTVIKLIRSIICEGTSRQINLIKMVKNLHHVLIVIYLSLNCKTSTHLKIKKPNLITVHMKFVKRVISPRIVDKQRISFWNTYLDGEDIGLFENTMAIVVISSQRRHQPL